MEAMRKKYDYIIGIDPGVNTGIAVWDVEKKALTAVGSFKIHEVLELAKSFYNGVNCFWRVEDARKRKWFGNNSAAKKQGAGSIKRDSGVRCEPRRSSCAVSLQHAQSPLSVPA